MHRSKPASSFDHLVGTRKQGGRDFQVQCFGSFEVDHQLEQGWLHDREIGRLRALENAAPVNAGYSKRTADKQGPRLQANPGVKAAIDAGKVKRSEKLEVDAEWMLQRLVAEVEADLADLYTDSGDIKPIDEWPEIWRQGLVAGLEVEALYEGIGKDRVQIGQVKKVRLSDRLRRLELIGKHIRVNAFQETVNVKGLDTLADRMERAKQRCENDAATKPNTSSAGPETLGRTRVVGPSR